MVCFQKDFSCCDQLNLIASKLWRHTSYCQSSIFCYSVIIYNLTCCSHLCSYVFLNCTLHCNVISVNLFVLQFHVRHFQRPLFRDRLDCQCVLPSVCRKKAKLSASIDICSPGIAGYASFLQLMLSVTVDDLIWYFAPGNGCRAARVCTWHVASCIHFHT